MSGFYFFIGVISTISLIGIVATLFTPTIPQGICECEECA